MHALKKLLPAAGLLAFASASAFAGDEPTLDKADTAWIMVAGLLVLLMTIPGIMLFYCGMVRKKNILSTLAQSLAICGLLTLVWYFLGYSLAFSEGSPFIGSLDKAFLAGISINTLSGSIPELLFVFFQMTFAILTPALITGAFAERMKFSSLIVFMVAWSILVYAPICHWVWGSDGYFCTMGALDYAGGTVVHINAGIAGLVGCLMLGPRRGYGTQHLAPSNLTFAVIGACLLWFGWMGFNGGSGLAANERAVMAILVTQIAAAAGAVAWMFTEWKMRGKPSVLGIISGAVAGLVAITPGSGFVEPAPALFIGLLAGVVCFFMVAVVKAHFGYDDSLDAFGVHGVGGILGAILTGFFASSAVTGSELPPMWTQVGIQALSVVATLVYGGVMSAIILYIIKKTMGLRVSNDDELAGLDLSAHGERIE
ncbi:ammonium transporter [Sutterella sp.]|uniref:ammonium transporter n=1 Tax=Sutterella sp. TaxID=1981025 RepID=UPI0026DF5567|nr:ammonium transporter [Sutterella sp.]MDO5530748.1 ammonium transporter [Sutterella sp.]